MWRFPFGWSEEDEPHAEAIREECEARCGSSGRRVQTEIAEVMMASVILGGP
jgi:hypothetical protein